MTPLCSQHFSYHNMLRFVNSNNLVLVSVSAHTKLCTNTLVHDDCTRYVLLNLSVKLDAKVKDKNIEQ